MAEDCVTTGLHTYHIHLVKVAGGPSFGHDSHLHRWDILS
jgi:hypothetical protein